MKKNTLFLCTGNYYRSKFSEIYFNYIAQKKNINWYAFSRGFFLGGQGNAGWIAPVAIDKLNELTVPIPKEFSSVLVNKDDFERAKMVIALSEKEHRPFMKHSFPEWENKIIYWNIFDQHDTPPKIALEELKNKIDNLLKYLN